MLLPEYHKVEQMYLYSSGSFETVGCLENHLRAHLLPVPYFSFPQKIQNYLCFVIPH